MTFILIATTIMVLMTIGAGVFLMYKKAEVSQKKLKKILRYNLFVFLPILIFSIILIVPNITNAQNTAASSSSGLGFIGAALSTGMATIGAGYAVGVVGASALGAVSEDPGKL